MPVASNDSIKESIVTSPTDSGESCKGHTASDKAMTELQNPIKVDGLPGRNVPLPAVYG